LFSATFNLKQGSFLAAKFVNFFIDLIQYAATHLQEQRDRRIIIIGKVTAATQKLDTYVRLSEQLPI
jgi:hypothetical protein